MRTSSNMQGVDGAPPGGGNDEMREFAAVLRQALLMIVRYLEKRYQLGR